MNIVFQILLSIFILIQLAIVLKAGLQPIPNDTGTSDLLQNSCIESTKGGKLAGSTRDCQAGQSEYCTLGQPCTPCSSGGCRSCSLEGTPEDCHFDETYGPYCDFGSSIGVAKCITCCSS